MNIVHVEEIPSYSRLGQNIIRHDGMLALPRGTVIRESEIKELRYRGIQQVLCYDTTSAVGDDTDTSFTMTIIKESYQKTSVWSPMLGKYIYQHIHREVNNNKKVEQYLNQLRKMDSYSFAHCINISLLVGNLLSFHVRDKQALAHMVYTALLHDVGRTKMVDLFGKKRKLTDIEYEKIKRHPEESFKMLLKAGFSEEDVAFVSQTHEKYNGTGYPLNLKGKQIASFGQLVLLADVYNALSSFRPHRDVFTPYEVMQIIREEEGKAFGKEVIQLFDDNFQPYQKGMKVELEDGEVAVIRNVQYNKILPVVDIISEQTGTLKETMDLSMNQHRRIKRILDY